MKKCFLTITFGIFSSLSFAAGNSNYSKCVSAQDREEIELAIQYCMDSANEHYHPAKLVLGHLYSKYLKRDLNLAAKWYLAFANSKDDGYQYGYAMLGSMELEMNNEAKALEWFQLCNQKPYQGCKVQVNKLKKHNQSLH